MCISSHLSHGRGLEIVSEEGMWRHPPADVRGQLRHDGVHSVLPAQARSLEPAHQVLVDSGEHSASLEKVIDKADRRTDIPHTTASTSLSSPFSFSVL